MLFEAQKGRAAMGFNYDFNWLNKGLYMRDGKTLVDPPHDTEQPEQRSKTPLPPK